VYAFDGGALAWFSGASRGTVKSVQPYGDLLVATASMLGVRIFDASAQTPVQIGGFLTPGTQGNRDSSAALLQISGQTLYVSDGRIGWSSYDLGAAPLAPPRLASVGAHDQSFTTVLAGGALWSCEDNAGLYGYDVGDPAAPRLLSSARFIADPHEACLDLLPAASAHRLYVGGFAHLGVLDITNPAAVAMLREVPSPYGGQFLSLAAGPAHTLLALTSSIHPGDLRAVTRLEVWDLSDPDHPSFVWASSDLGGSGWMDSVVVADHTAYVAARYAGIQVFDLSSPRAPVRLGTIPVAAGAWGLSVKAGRLHVALGEGGVGSAKLLP
jgi:hypothetical protein